MLSRKLLAFIFLIFSIISIINISSYYQKNQSSNNQQEKAYKKWIQKYSQIANQWTSTQKYYRKYIFIKNYLKIQQHNQRNNQTYKMAINQFTPLTQQQFQYTYLSPIKIQPNQYQILINNNNNGKNLQQHESRNLVANPTININWVQAGMVSPVQNQGSCGGCWSFSATGVLESFYRIAKVNSTVQLSQQQLLDCTYSYGNNGCDGGLAINALMYVLQNGITTEAEYPYMMISGQCQVNGGNFKINSVNTTYGCTGLLNTLQNSPVSIGVNANNWNWYGSGIFSNCISNSNDHAVLLVGATNQYWIVKNSWGPDWGQSGYIKLSPGNTCGLCSQLAPYVL